MIMCISTIKTFNTLIVSVFNFTRMEHSNQHRGDKLANALRSRSVNLKKLADSIVYNGKTGIDRGTLYNWFTDENLAMDKIVAIAVQEPRICEDFAEIELSAVNEERGKYIKPTGFSAECRKEIDYWKDQYIAMTTEVMNLQSELLKLRTAE